MTTDMIEEEEAVETPCEICGGEAAQDRNETALELYVARGSTYVHICGECELECCECRGTRTSSEMRLVMYSAYNGYYYFCTYCVTECAACGDIVTNEDACYCDDSGDHRCESCTEYCDACDEHTAFGHEHEDEADDDRVHSYGYKPISVFFGGAALPGTPYIGIEHELEAKEDIGKIVDLFLTADSSLFYPKHDGSLSDGVEIVSHPMTFEYFEESYPFEVFETLWQVASHKDRDGDATSGVHIHVSKDAFSSYHLYKFLHFHYELSGLVQRIAGRSGSHWASFEKEGRGNREQLQKLLGEARKKDTNYNRYQCVNVQNSATVELRYFRSTVRELRLRGYVQWVRAVYEYTKDPEVKVRCKAHKDREISQEGFTRWVEAHNGDGRYVHCLNLMRGVEGY